eukprot:TRINITY_DN9939_c0_g1_i1.p1 TRINITY_DN9939_c0_g1~~TRINITY_DN9939_c0_g1_i1.p1  ORF type:complete len:610 (+),score=99.91 TRINITY_DN9939_c0_g1_i1:45-1874(+)
MSYNAPKPIRQTTRGGRSERPRFSPFADRQRKTDAEVSKAQRTGKCNLSFHIIQTLPPALKKNSKLIELDISCNQLESIPSEVFLLTTLQSLNFSWNRLILLPPDISALVHLTKLAADFNQIRALPSSIGSLTKMQAFSMTDNMLSSLPSEIGNLQQLRELNFRYNHIEVVPAELCLIPQTCELNLSGNPLLIPPQEVYAAGKDRFFAHLRKKLTETELPRPPTQDSAGPSHTTPQRPTNIADLSLSLQVLSVTQDKLPSPHSSHRSIDSRTSSRAQTSHGSRITLSSRGEQVDTSTDQARPSTSYTVFRGNQSNAPRRIYGSEITERASRPANANISTSGVDFNPPPTPPQSCYLPYVPFPKNFARPRTTPESQSSLLSSASSQGQGRSLLRRQHAQGHSQSSDTRPFTAGEDSSNFQDLQDLFISPVQPSPTSTLHDEIESVREALKRRNPSLIPLFESAINDAQNPTAHGLYNSSDESGNDEPREAQLNGNYEYGSPSDNSIPPIVIPLTPHASTVEGDGDNELLSGPTSLERDGLAKEINDIPLTCEDEEPSTGMECVVCLSAKKRVAVFPCAHIVYCLKCYRQVDKNLCPICRQVARSFVKMNY